MKPSVNVILERTGLFETSVTRSANAKIYRPHKHEFTLIPLRLTFDLKPLIFKQKNSSLLQLQFCKNMRQIIL